MAKNLAQRFFMVAFLAANLALGTARAQTRPAGTPGDVGPHPGGFNDPGTVTIEAPAERQKPQDQEDPPAMSHRRGEESDPERAGLSHRSNQGTLAGSRASCPPGLKPIDKQPVVEVIPLDQQEDSRTVVSDTSIEETRVQTQLQSSTASANACAYAQVFPTPSGPIEVQVEHVWPKGAKAPTAYRASVSRGKKGRSWTKPVYSGPSKDQMMQAVRAALQAEGVVRPVDLTAATNSILDQLKLSEQRLSEEIEEVREDQEAGFDRVDRQQDKQTKAINSLSERLKRYDFPQGLYIGLIIGGALLGLLAALTAIIAGSQI